MELLGAVYAALFSFLFVQHLGMFILLLLLFVFKLYLSREASLTAMTSFSGVN